MLAAELGIGSGAMEESVPGEAGNGKRRNAMKVFSTGSPNCRWSTRLATPLVMLSRKSLTNNGTTKRSKQAVAGQAREVAGGRMLAGQWTRGGGARAEACPPPAARPFNARWVAVFLHFAGSPTAGCGGCSGSLSNLQDVGGRSKSELPEKTPTFPTGDQRTRSRSVCHLGLPLFS